MKRHFILQLVASLFLLSFYSCQTSVPAANNNTTDSTQAGTTTIYVVRHAEKDTSDSKNQDPNLSEAGRKRANALRDLYDQEAIAAFYATKYVRTSQTLQPLAAVKKMEIRTYEGHDFEGLKQQIMQNHKGKTVFVAGHSNTVLSIIKAFGATPPREEIRDEEYSYIFTIKVSPENTATVEEDTFEAVANQ
ncbi:histidine phosphatase family protein [Pontibacter arcticus]|uniref:Histidine phosphatase family protein n=1 Tax=Pontibacter arcticus TaxID=2080288 RepID=A0A364RDM2_9BACT|nr:histidine phosphatase family protein [Pontibacter arcticus]RAU82345.1 histidine phosphatase family protein [Pontibacter arcticus]